MDPGPGIGALCALGSALMWALTSFLVRTLSPIAGAVAVNAVRTTLAAALLLAWTVVTGGAAALAAVPGATHVLFAVSIVAAVVVGDNCFFESCRRLGLARAMTISTTYPLVSTVLAAIVLDEPITTPVVVGSVVALAGLALIVSGPAPEAEIADGWWVGLGAAALASIGWGVAPILMKAPLREMDATTAQAIRLPMAAAMLWVMPWTWGAVARLRAGGRQALARMLVLSVLTVASSILFIAGLKYAGVAVAMVLSSTAPMFAIPLGFVFLGERLGRRAIAGTVVTVIGIAILQG